MMRRPLLALTLALLTVLGLAGTASALPADKHVELEADDGQGCASGNKADCYRVVNGTSLDGIAQGDVVHVKLVNVGSNPHNVFVTQSSNADENNVDTAGDDAINSSETIDGGEQTDMVFQVPDDAEGLYFWCDVDTHEALGMWLQTDVATNVTVNGTDEGNQTAADNDTADEGDGGEGDDVGRFLPAPGPMAALAATLSATVLAARTRE